MLSNPVYGWCLVDVPGWKTGQASYLEDYPVTFAHAMLSAIGKSHTWFDYPDEPEYMKTTAIVDCEGAGRFAIRFSDGEVAVFDDDPVFEASPIAKMPLVDGELEAMCRMLANDIEADKAEWVEWDLSIPDDDDDIEGAAASMREARRLLLDEIISDLRSV